MDYIRPHLPSISSPSPETTRTLKNAGVVFFFGFTAYVAYRNRKAFRFFKEDPLNLRCREIKEKIDLMAVNNPAIHYSELIVHRIKEKGINFEV
jgi:hypothetical protein